MINIFKNRILPLPYELIRRVLENLGEAVIAVCIYVAKNLYEFLILTAKLIWEKSIKLRIRVFNFLKYAVIVVASPLVKQWIRFSNMRRDIKKERRKKGIIAAAVTFFTYLIRFLFGKKGFIITSFNYVTPIISIFFLFSVVTYATSASHALKLTVNGQFLGYIDNEQVFMEAEAFVLQRVNYFGSAQTIEIVPEFAIAGIGSSERLTTHQVANEILKISEFNLVNAYGFFIDGVCLGAILEDDIHLIRTTMDSLLAKYRTGLPGEEVTFLNNVEWDKNELFLDDSVVDPWDIIRIISATRRVSEFSTYVVVSGDTQCLISEVLGMSEEEIEKLNPGFIGRTLHPGDQITSSNEVFEPYLPVIVTVIEEYETNVAYKTEYRDDSDLFIGSSSVKIQGVQGVNFVVANVSYVNGAEINRNPISVTVVSEPVTKIVHNGTKPLPAGRYSTEQAQYGLFIWPTDGGYISSDYGRDSSWGRNHRGIDIAGIGLNSPIFAAGSGTVVLAQYSYGSYGHTVIIQHDNGLRTLYAHNNELQVKVGDTVTLGEQIANAGSTGYSTGVHLHFEVRSGNEMLNPNNYLPQR